MNAWLHSYLSRRQQYVVYGDTSSDKLDTSCGVPQVSILGLLLFIIYLNDLPLLSQELSTIMFADDTTFFLEHDNLESAVKIMSDNLADFAEWLRINKLYFNTTKTKCMFLP